MDQDDAQYRERQVMTVGSTFCCCHCLWLSEGLSGRPVARQVLETARGRKHRPLSGPPDLIESRPFLLRFLLEL